MLRDDKPAVAGELALLFDSGHCWQIRFPVFHNVLEPILRLVFWQVHGVLTVIVLPSRHNRGMRSLCMQLHPSKYRSDA
jgi:hypothetical protein